MFNIEKVVTFDPPYSLYFNELSRSIESLIGKKLKRICLSPNYAYRVYLPDFDFRYGKTARNFDVPELYYKRVKLLKSLGNLSGEISGDELEFAVRFYCFVENYFKDNRNCVVLVYNDLRWHHAIGIDVMERLGVKYFVFERGVFRPFTTSMDERGVNANSSVKIKSLEGFSKKKPVDFSSSSEDEYFINIRFFFFKICEKFLLILGRYREINHAKKKRLVDYFSIYFRQKILYYSFFWRKRDEKVPSGKFLFVPLQLSSDTQTLLNSPFLSSQEFVSTLERAFYSTSLYPNYRIVFKEHPMSNDNIVFDKRSVCSFDDVKNITDHSLGVITINSTVGFEALFRGKKVMTLGESFYTRDDVVFKCEAHNLMQGLEEFVNTYEFPKSVESFLRMVEHDYQVPGSVYRYSKDNLASVAEKIIKKTNAI